MKRDYKLCMAGVACVAVIACGCSGPTQFVMRNTGKSKFTVSIIEDGKIRDSAMLGAEGMSELSCFKPYNPVLRLKNLESGKVTEFPLDDYGYKSKKGDRKLTINTDGQEFSMPN